MLAPGDGTSCHCGEGSRNASLGLNDKALAAWRFVLRQISALTHDALMG